MNNANIAQRAGVRLPLGINRLNLTLLVLLLVQIALAALILRPRPVVTAGGAPLLGELTAQDITGISITDNTDRTIAFIRTADGWAMDGTDGYPANATKIDQTLAKLLDIKTDRLVTRTAGSHARLQVADNNYQRRIQMTTATGSRTILLGSSAGAGATHVRADSHDEVYLTAAIATWELDTFPSSWLDTAYFRLDLERIRAVTLENAAGSVTLVPDGEGWTLADLAPGETPLSANIRGLVSRAASINLSRPLGTQLDPAYGLDAPQATLTLIAEDEQGTEQTYTILVGAKDPETNTYFVKASNSDYYVTVAGFTGDEFTSKRRADFLAATPDEPSTPPDESGDAAEDEPAAAAPEDAPDLATPEADAQE